MKQPIGGWKGAIVAIVLGLSTPCMAQHGDHGHDHGHEHEHGEDRGSDRTTITRSAQASAGIETETAGPREISTYERVYGRIIADENRVAHVKPRFAGVVISIAKDLGDEVGKGDLLAVVESNQSLQPYEIRSRTKGVIVQRHATSGEVVQEDRNMFVVADLSEVWADFLLYRHDLPEISRGQEVTIDLGDRRPEIRARISYLSPVTDEATQSKLVRAVLPNPDGRLAPGLFVSGRIALRRGLAAIAVSREAIQTLNDREVVFLADGEELRAVPVEIGRMDSDSAEILSGVAAGDRYVSRSSFIVKADIEKSGAGHDH